jgi:hypothetical protein
MQVPGHADAFFRRRRLLQLSQAGHGDEKFGAALPGVLKFRTFWEYERFYSVVKY